MLVLTRKPDETIMIGDDIEVSVVRIGRDKVTLGVTAPDGLKILRGELKDKTQAGGGGVGEQNTTGYMDPDTIPVDGYHLHHQDGVGPYSQTSGRGAYTQQL